LQLYKIKSFKLIFWDFDGVIKESVEIKAQAYIKIFEHFGPLVTNKIRKHHEANGGVSRFDKLPLYLEWSGVEPNPYIITEYCEKFSKIVIQAVIDSPWVIGVEDYLRSYFTLQNFVLVSATPQDELEYILRALNLKNCFSKIYGAPIPKHDAIRKTLLLYGIDKSDCLMIGDALSDLYAASINQIPFLLRRHDNNSNLFFNYTGNFIKDFSAL